MFSTKMKPLSPEIKKQLEKRNNVLLIGDNLGDLGMSKGIKHENILKICFLNEDVEENIEEYKKYYDVLITGDGDFTFILNLLKEIR